MKNVIVSPSILNVKYEELKEKVLEVEKSQGNWLHFDVMDGKFVSNKSFESSLLTEIKEYSSLFMDVHLMVEDLDKYILEYTKAGANLISFHFEATKEVLKYINLIKEFGLKAGLVIKPETNVNEIVDYLDNVDLILVMSVEPGAGGQKFQDQAINKVKELAKLKKKNHLNFLIEVDGGINNKTGKLVKKAGANVLVAGSYIFNSEDITKAIKSLK